MLNSLTALMGGISAPAGDYESIATSLVSGSSTTTITFSSIPSTYQHLQLRFISHVEASNYALVSFNGDTSTSNYTWHYLSGDGASASAGGNGSGSFGACVVNYVAASGATSVYGAAIFDILDYANTNKYKTTRSLNGQDKNGSGNIQLTSNAWLSTSAISSISITFNGGNVISAGSHFALYGIKG